MGRKRETRRFRAEKQATIVRCLRAGFSQRTAIALSGISRDTYYRWRREYPDFDLACEQAEYEALSSVEGTVHSLAIMGNLHACTWLLERRHPDYRPPSRAKEREADEDYTVELEVAHGDAPYKVQLRQPTNGTKPNR